MRVLRLKRQTISPLEIGAIYAQSAFCVARGMASYNNPSSNQPAARATKSQPSFPVLYRFEPSKDSLGTADPASAASHFHRSDTSPDGEFYKTPRYVTHIDDGAISALSRYMATVLPSLDSFKPGDASQDPRFTPPSASSSKPRLLDLCSSWVSHYPAHIEAASASQRMQVFGLGMNKAELDKNKLLDSGGRVVWDLNDKPDLKTALIPLLRETKSETPTIPSTSDLLEEQKLVATTCTVSIDYLVHPVQVLASLRDLTCLGGSVHLAISNRCFPTKAVSRWLRASEDERLRMTCRDLWHAGWRDVEVVQVTDGKPHIKGAHELEQPAPGSLAMIAKMLGMDSMGEGDPLWVVRGRNLGDRNSTEEDGKGQSEKNRVRPA